MRIIGGALRGRRIASPRGRGTRPMLDRVREAVFSTLMPWLDEARVLDLFSGTGSLGIEALSRGATRVRFVEREPSAAALLTENLHELELFEKAVVIRGDALDSSSWGEGPGFDLVFLDPPYALLEEERSRARVLHAVEELIGSALSPEGVVVFHAPKGAIREASFPEGARIAERRYGTNALWYAQAPEDPEDPEDPDDPGASGSSGTPAALEEERPR